MSDPTIDSSQVPDGAAVADGQAAETSPNPAGAMATALADHLDALDAAIEALPGVETFVLPSGVKVNMMPGKGRDLLAAQRVAGEDTHQVMYALAAVLCTFDGMRKVMEDVLEMPLGDVMKLMTKIGGQAGDAFLPSTSAASSTSRP
jgi:hypothetical protein